MLKHISEFLPTALEKKARETETVCRGCGGQKDAGVGACIVCWECWRREDLPFKYWNGTLDTWLETLKALQTNPF